MASSTWRNRALFNPSDPKDAEYLLTLLDDEELDKECENLLERLNVDSDLEGYSSDESVVEIDMAPKRVIRVGADAVRKGDEILLENEIRDINEAQENFEATEEETADSTGTFSYTKVKNIRWQKKKYIQAEIIISNYQNHLDQNQIGLPYPIEYFYKYLPDDMFEKISCMTNIYALQKDVKSFRNTNADEIKNFFGLHIIMSCLKFPRVRMYWERILHIDLFVKTMTRNRFFQLRSCIHVVNNLEKPADCRDKLFKVRPMFDSIRKRCLELEPEANFCVDEQMVPFRGHLSIKQYVKGKPNPWGIKIFVLCGQSGIAYDFIIYQGESTGLDSKMLKEFGLGASVVLHLAVPRIPQHSQLFFDNFFSSYGLFEALKDKSIYAAGTIRVNRFRSPPFTSDKETSKKNRGYNEEVVSEDGKVVLCKWVDNRSVILGSNFVGVGAEDEAQRWDRKEKKYIKIKRPEVVKLYNRSMGGVDKLDQLLGTYRIFIKSKKWTLRMFFHAVDLACVNSWLEYKRDAAALNVPTKDVLDLLNFKMRIGESLIRVAKLVHPKKRGRPSSTGSESPRIATKRATEVRPLVEIQTDHMDHMPDLDENKEATRCKNKNCGKRTHIYCDKCNVHLCFVRGRNCFKSFHRQ